MNVHQRNALPGNGKDQTAAIIKVAALAVGGQGGGVLTDWITTVAESNGFRAQATSVAGVAQRTGATIYYIEMTPDTGREPVFSLSPSPGDVDILIAAEMMEAGRAITRGFVTPDRTTLIASSHRILAVTEKIVPGDGAADKPAVLKAAEEACHRLICFDMEKIALEAGTIISASLFGALAGSGTLPFPRESFEEQIRASGRGVEASLKAFAIAYDKAAKGEGDDPAPKDDAGQEAAAPVGPKRLLARWDALAERAGKLPAPVKDMALRGLTKVVDYQDLAYGGTYLDRLDRAIAADSAKHDYRFSVAAAKYLANAMVYDDILRVADLKTRASRSHRVRREQGVNEGNVLHVTEYFHPRMEEICGTLPAPLGRWIEARPGLFDWFDRRLNKGRRIRTDSLTGYMMLWTMATLRPWRRALLRHTVEEKHLEDWFATALEHVKRDYDLGAEILKCRRLIKGYSDTHERGHSKYNRVLSALPLLDGRKDAGTWLRRLRDAALLDEEGKELDGALETVRTL